MSNLTGLGFEPKTSRFRDEPLEHCDSASKTRNVIDKEVK